MEQKNSNLIERYVYDVARRLPEKEREDVKKELRANLYDMLPAGASDDAVKKVLYELGSPVSLAEKYRTHPRYLISPAYFDEYLAALKWILPLVGVLVMLIGFAVGAFDAAKISGESMPFVISGILSNGVSMGVSAAFQALVWTTIGFAIAEHSGAKKQKVGEHGWRVEDLPEVQNPKAGIPLSEGIAELVLSVVFSIFALLFCTGQLPFAMIFAQGDMVFYNIFSQSFLNMLVPFILVSLLLSMVQAVAKIKDRSWSVFVCAAVVTKRLIDMAITLYLINQPNILSAEFQGFLTQTGVTQVIPNVNGTNVLVIAFCVLTIIGTIAETVKAIKLTVQAHIK
jgi:hypothetical protein